MVNARSIGESDVDEHRKIDVKTRLTAEEYVALMHIADTKGLSQSALIRMWVKEAIAAHCAEQLSKEIEPGRDEVGLSNVRPFDTFSFGKR